MPNPAFERDSPEAGEPLNFTLGRRGNVNFVATNERDYMCKLLAIFAFPLLLLAGLSGCGGGGGGGAPVAAQFPIGSAMSAFFQASHSYTLIATNGANTYTFQTSYTPGTASVFEGQQASTYTQSGSIAVNGVVTGGVSSGVSYINLSPYKNLGYIGSNGHYQVYAYQQTFPTYATVGQSGPLDASITYTNNTKAVIYANDSETWSLLSDTSTTAWACYNDTYTIVGSSPVVLTNCFKIDTTGNVLALKVIIPINGIITLTFM